MAKPSDEHTPLGDFVLRQQRFSCDVVHNALCKMGYIVPSVEPDPGLQRLTVDPETNQGGSTMSGTEIIPVDKSRVSTSHLRERLFTAGYLAICAVAMIGWLIALGWAAIRLAGWLFS
jgi:hypothetical protein